jgi:KDO2-lipid IV(A) lauroyltransferase
LKIEYLAARYWGVWLLIGVMRLIVLLPYSCQLFLGRLLGKISYYFAPYRRHITEINLRLCFPLLDSKQQHNLVKRCFESAGMGIIETGMAWWMPPWRLKNKLHISGIEHIQAAKQSGDSLIVLGGHFTCMELVGRLYALQDGQFHLLYRPHKNLLFNDLMTRKRASYVNKVISKNDIRDFMHSIRKKITVWYSPDQDYGKEHSVFAPFFGIPTATIAILPRLIRNKPAIVIPACYHRLENNQGYELIFYPPLKKFPSGDDVFDATQINQALEADLKQHPDQYLWQHRRFKTRPEGDHKFY